MDDKVATLNQRELARKLLIYGCIDLDADARDIIYLESVGAAIFNICTWCTEKTPLTYLLARK